MGVRVETLRRYVFLPLLVTLVGCRGDPGSSPRSGIQSGPSSAETSNRLGPQSQAFLHTVLDAGNLPDLRWPDFTDYRYDLEKFYAGSGWTLVWVKEWRATPQALALIASLQNAGEKGLAADDYDGSRWSDRLARLPKEVSDSNEPDFVRFDIALTVSAMRYISDLHTGRVNPRRLDFAADVAERKYNLPEFLREHVVQAPDIAAVLHQVEPSYPGYQRTIQALHRYREIAQIDDFETLPPIKRPIQPGESYRGIPQLARMLRLLGDLPENAPVEPDSLIHRRDLVEAVRHFQNRIGLISDGRIDAKTIAELNVPLSKRIRQMELTLERWRWLPDEYQHSPIVVNIPEFRLRAYDDQMKIAVTMKVVVGEAYGHSTPIFMDQMRTVIFRPYWNVPSTIAQAEVIPNLKKDSNYLAEQDMEIVDSRENLVSASVVTRKMIREIQDEKLYVRQRPGPKNSLGLIKFMFPNDYNVYMHGTPATELFAKSRRDFSHGCIRLEEPAELAAWVLRNNPDWDLDHIHEAMDGIDTIEVTLAHPIPVLIVYATVIVSEDGLVHFYDDIYGHDAALDQVLVKGPPYPR